MNIKDSCIIIGGGKSVRKGIETGLWDKIKNKDVWSLNYTYKLYPYKPSRECFVDFSFYKNNAKDIKELYNQGVPIYSKQNSKFKRINNDYIILYNTVREKGSFRGRQALKTPPEPHLFIGQMGLVGTFALSLAIAEGYKDIFLLGYDFGPPKPTDKDTHWYQKQIKVESTGVGVPNVYWNKGTGLRPHITDYKVFNQVKDANIYNVSLQSNIEYFQKISYNKFYELIGEKGDN